MTRLLWFLLSLLGGLALVALALMVPVHFRAADARVIAAAQENTPSLVDAGVELVRKGRLGPAEMLLEAARAAGAPDLEQLKAAVASAARSRPDLMLLGAAEPSLDPLFRPAAESLAGQPVVQLLLPPELHRATLERLRQSSHPIVSRLLAVRNLTNTVHFPPVSSASGQALDVAILMTALLIQTDHFAPPLRNQIEFLAKEARWGQMEKLELVFLDLLSLGKRLNWAQLTQLLGNIQEPATLQVLADQAGGPEERLPVVFAAAHFAVRPADLARYFSKAGPAAFSDLTFALRHRQGGLRKLLATQKPLYHAKTDLASLLRLEPVGDTLTTFALNSRWLALVLKLALFFDGAFLLALAGTYLLPAEEFERRLVSPTQLALTATLLAFTLVWSEPFLLQQPQNVPMPLHWQFPMVEGPVRAAIQKKVTPMVDTLSLVSLSFFLVIQVIIYMFCRRKLAEIEHLALPGKLKLKLLENEEHLFDAGLYCGFVGTVLSLVCVSLGIIKPSLMAAYSSTSFGIIFVSVLKIFYLRPYRKKLIIETETTPE